MAASTSETVRARAGAAIRAATAQPATIETLAKFGIEATPISQPEFAAAMRASYAAWAERLRKLGFKPET
jgi:tripartite-type tricarboxylate transporter receptor subunit TctC